ncbi:MAG: bifunctional glutamate N-acetyltransferase/amino-acid acetyltransferase ArgJ [Pirellulaceae bacterium]
MLPPVPSGFRLTGVHCGIKVDATKNDLTLVVADQPATAAAVYTQNVIVAAPVVFDRERTPSDHMRVVVVNSGNANACTGERGWRDAQEMAQLAAESVAAEASQSLVMSTGVIGQFLPMEEIAAGIRAAAEQLGDQGDALLAAAHGIMTTDKGPKIAGRSITIQDRQVHVTGIAKGAGMIGPKMATMLAVILTDAALRPHEAQRALQEAVDQSFNCISVEGHMSTNDTVLLLASGAAVGEMGTEAHRAEFQATLNELCVDLACMIPDDGEGASHLITIHVSGCAHRDDAFRIAQTIANSPLVKTGIAGADPNWGRFLSAAGQAGVDFNPDGVTLSLNGMVVYRDGAPVDFDRVAASDSIRDQRETLVEIQFGEGDASVRFWTSDLTVDYVRLNSEYTS